MHCLLHGLTSSAGLNGLHGMVLGVQDGRYIVSIGKRKVLVKSSNITVMHKALPHLSDALRRGIFVHITPNHEISAYGFWLESHNVIPPPESCEVWHFLRTKSTTNYVPSIDVTEHAESIMVDGPKAENLMFILMTSEASSDFSSSLLVEIVWRKSDNFVASLHRQALHETIFPSHGQLEANLKETLCGEARDTQHLLVTSPH